MTTHHLRSARSAASNVKILAALLGFIMLAADLSAAPTINANNHYSYGANIGFMDWAPNGGYGVSIGEFVCAGYVYAANVGWISLGSGFPTNGIQYSNNSAADFGVNYSVDPTQPGVAVLRGYAYGGNVGWINFEATGNARLSLFTGTFSGYAYSANCGWINLGDFNVHVQTDRVLMGVDTNSNGIADAWELLYFGALLAPGAENTDPNRTGMTLLQDYLEGTDPQFSDALRIVSFGTSGGGASSSLTFVSNVARLYSIQTNTNLSLLNGWTDAGLGIFAPDAGARTTRILTSLAGQRRFYRVTAIRPLP